MSSGSRPRSSRTDTRHVRRAYRQRWSWGSPCCAQIRQSGSNWRSSAYNIDPTNGDSRSKLAEAYNAAGLYYRELGDDERAAGYFAEALHLYPDNQGYQDNYDSVG